MDAAEGNNAYEVQEIEYLDDLDIPYTAKVVLKRKYIFYYLQICIQYCFVPEYGINHLDAPAVISMLSATGKNSFCPKVILLYLHIR